MPDRIVQTLHDIAVKTGIGAPFFRRRGIKRHMGKIMGEIKKQRFIARRLGNKSFRRFGVKRVERGLVNGCCMAYLLARIRRAANQRERVHIIGIISAEKALKAKLRRHRTGMVAHMPFADHCGFIADRMQNIRNENFLARQAHRIAEKPVEAVKYRARRKRHMGEPGARCHAAGQHGGARRRTDRRRGVIIFQHQAIGGQLVHMRRGNHLIAGKADIAIAQIIKQNDHQIGGVLRCGAGDGGQIIGLRRHMGSVIKLLISSDFDAHINNGRNNGEHRQSQ